jgi:hypothetical protein
LKPDFKTIADFRSDNRAAFKKVFREFVILCRRLDLFGRELLAGAKITDNLQISLEVGRAHYQGISCLQLQDRGAGPRNVLKRKLRARHFALCAGPSAA